MTQLLLQARSEANGNGEDLAKAAARIERRQDNESERKRKKLI